MPTGTLKMWNAERGYGFIADDAGGPDMFLHVSALQSAGIDPDNIRKGERLSFDVESTREGKTRAANPTATASKPIRFFTTHLCAAGHEIEVRHTLLGWP